MENYITLNIKHLCSVNNLTQNDFGSLFDLKRSVVGMYVSGKATPKVDTIQKICVHFGITIDDFINKKLSDLGTNIINEEPAAYGIEALENELVDKNKIIELLERENKLLRGIDVRRKTS